MTYAEAIEFLYGLRVFGAKLGLENTLRLASLAGNPEKRLKFIHVAGTNGKGSTCAMLESIYRAAGLRVGLFTSPHLVSFTERIQVNRAPIPENDVVRLLNDHQLLAGAFSSESQPTFFEVVTVMALRCFAESLCDVVIWETGLGGRLDATNIVTPLASVITNIGLDHQQWLGSTHAQIAAEKAGIIKPGVPVITAAEPGKGLEVIAEVARQKDAPLTIIDSNDAQGPLLDAARVPLVGDHQRLNGAVAIATVRAVQSQLRVSQEDILMGLSTVNWPGRMQLVTRDSGQRILLDGAHNVPGAEALARTFQQHFPDASATLILGMLADKDWRPMTDILAPLGGRLLLVPVGSHRTLAPEEIASACRQANPEAEVSVCSSLVESLRLAERDPLVLVTGSLYLVGEALEYLRLLTSPGGDERGLNEWTQRR